VLLVAILVAGWAGFDAFTGDPFAWVVLTALFGVMEAVDLSFQGRRGRVGLSAAEAVLMPMLFAFSEQQVVWGVAIAIAGIRIVRWRQGWPKGIYNVAQYGIAAALAAGVWVQFGHPSDAMTVQNAGAAVLAVIVFALVTHSLTMFVVSLAEGASFRAFMGAVAGPAAWNLLGAITFGLLLSAAFEAARWTVILFPLPLAGLFLGYRAVVRQSRDRERIEQLHAASRSLASTPDLGGALSKFLDAVQDIASASGARAVIKTQKKVVWTGVQGEEILANLDPIDGGAMSALLEAFESDPTALVIREDSTGRHRDLLESFGVRSMIAAPLLDDEFVLGYLVATDRVGTDEFDKSDVRLLEALGHELVVSLDSHRLFARVSEERERFRRIFRGSAEGICMLDERGIVRAWNPALEQISGYEENEMIGHRWSDKLVVRDWAQKRIQGRELIEVRADAELELVTKEGPTRWISVLSDEIPSGEEKGWVVMVRDVTALHAAEEAKSDFLSTISHELRTPLTTIKGSLQVLGRGVEQLPEGMAEQMVAVMRRGSDRLERLVMNLLTVSQLETGGMNVFTEELTLRELVDAAVDNAMRDHAKRVIEIEPEQVTIRADRERFMQALSQLLDNAVKFGGAQGTVKVCATQRNGYACISVSDEGPGVPKADRERIFERFVRLGSLLTRETQGAGVGLFIAKKSVEAMNGNIYVEGGAETGATFTIEIPLAYPMAVADPASA
jgi:PAS domain S-box-containing protein